MAIIIDYVTNPYKEKGRGRQGKHLQSSIGMVTSRDEFVIATIKLLLVREIENCSAASTRLSFVVLMKTASTQS